MEEWSETEENNGTICIIILSAAVELVDLIQCTIHCDTAPLYDSCHCNYKEKFTGIFLAK